MPTRQCHECDQDRDNAGRGYSSTQKGRAANADAKVQASRNAKSFRSGHVRGHIEARHANGFLLHAGFSSTPYQ